MLLLPLMMTMALSRDGKPLELNLRANTVVHTYTRNYPGGCGASVEIKFGPIRTLTDLFN